MGETAHELYSRALPLAQAGDLQAAADLLGRAVAVDAGHAESHLLLGTLCEQGGNLPQALALFEHAHRLRPTWPGPLMSLGNVLLALGRVGEAVAAHRRAVEVQPAFVPGWINLANALSAAREHEAAVGAADRALALDARQPLAWYNKGVSLAALSRLGEAADAYRACIRLQPGFPPAHNNLGNMYERTQQPDAALAAYREALRLNPAYPQALNNLGCLLHRVGELEDSLAIFRRALELHPGFALAHSNLLYLLLFYPAATPEMLRAEHEAWNVRHGRSLAGRIPRHSNDRSPGRRLRVGYVSADFRDHVVARNLLPVFRHHDKSRFEVFVYANTAVVDGMSREFQSLADQWRGISSLNDEQAAALIQQDRIDLLVDLSLHMAGNRLSLFACRPAPVQLTFAGYPGTTGLTAIDYRVTDPYLDPRPAPGQTDPADEVYSEKSLRLPHTFWIYDPLGIDISVNPLPAHSAGYVTFGCLNNFCKLNVQTFGRWAPILRALPSSRLLLLAEEGSHRERTRDAFAGLGISPERVVFSPILPREDYLRLYHRIDIALDTLPYNGHTTTLDALWMGVPVVTQVGATVAGRAALSQLTNLGLEDLITYTLEQFVQTTLALAGDLSRLSTLRRTLRTRLQQSPLSDAPAFTRALESLYRHAWHTYSSSS